MWKKYFKIIGIVPGEVIVPGHGKIDFRNENISVEVCLQLLENDFPYLAITEEGKDFFYGKQETKQTPKRIRSSHAKGRRK